MDIVYSYEEAPQTYKKSIFLVGPTPRDKSVPSWRPQMIKHLEECGYDGVVFVPESREGKWSWEYDDQVEWEKKHLEMADMILAWVPRDLATMPAFTTNVEFGKYVASGKLIYGRPDDCPKNRYLDWLYADHGHGEPCNDMREIAAKTVIRLGHGAARTAGERNVPLMIWSTNMFQSWYGYQQYQGNRLDDAKVLWAYRTPSSNEMFAYCLWAKMWVHSENRHKENEFVLSRPDIYTVLAYRRAEDILDSKVVTVKEYRTPVLNMIGKVLELPSGSSKERGKSPVQIACEELKEETGLEIDVLRLVPVMRRQMCSTFSSHGSILYSVELTEDELREVERRSSAGQTFGLSEDTERTTTEIKTLRQLLWTGDMDWPMIGMVLDGVLKNVPQDRPVHI